MYFVGLNPEMRCILALPVQSSWSQCVFEGLCGEHTPKIFEDYISQTFKIYYYFFNKDWMSCQKLSTGNVKAMQPWYSLFIAYI